MMLKLMEDVLWCCREVARIAKRIERFDRSLATQLRTAIASVALNTGEAEQSYDGHGRQRFRTALQSAREVDITLRVAHAFEYTGALDDALMQRLDSIRARLWKLARGAPLFAARGGRARARPPLLSSSSRSRARCPRRPDVRGVGVQQRGLLTSPAPQLTLGKGGWADD